MTADYQETNSANTLFYLNHLAIIEVSGDDALPFLQGQLTCNLKELTDCKTSIAAFCNPKGRVISTLLLFKTESSFGLILPRSLLEKVLKKLQMYVLRAKVKLTDKTDTLTLIGVSCSNDYDGFALPTENFECSHGGAEIFIKLPSLQRRFLCVAEACADLSASLPGFAAGTDDEWRYLDISSGFPWFDIEQSEKHIPQMLNIEQLGGISFNKGCYTGQEIIARTHYLGKAKRQLYLAECKPISEFAGNLTVKDAETQENIGEILALQTLGRSTRMLAVLQTLDGKTKNLILDAAEQTPLTLIPYQ